MNRTVTVKIGDRERLLNYSIDLMFEVGEKFGNISKALEIVSRNDKSGFEAVCWFALRLAKDGELLRRAQGEDAVPFLGEKELSPRMHPLEFSELREKVVEAIILGYQREFKDENEEVDLVMQELNAKKTKAGI